MKPYEIWLPLSKVLSLKGSPGSTIWELYSSLTVEQIYHEAASLKYQPKTISRRRNLYQLDKIKQTRHVNLIIGRKLAKHRKYIVPKEVTTHKQLPNFIQQLTE